MTLMRSRSLHCRKPKGLGWIAALLAALMVCGLLLAASPALHGALHSDAKSPFHQCAISLLAHGYLLPADTAAMVATCVHFWAGMLLRLDNPIPSSPDHRFSFSRAPPLSV